MSRRARYRWLEAAACLCLLLGGSSTSAATYYVATTGNDTNDGTAEATAWASVTYAATQALAGDTVYVKAGLYHGELVYVKNSGTEQAPIIFEGYTTTPGDSPDPGYIPGEPLNSSLIPVLEGEATPATEDMGFEVGNKAFVEIRNFGATKYNFGFFAYSSRNVTLENVYAVSIGPGEGFGLMFRSCDHCTIRDSVATDAYGDNIFIWKSTACVVENTKTYAVAYEPPEAATDYHIVIADSQDLIIRDCYSENLHTQVASAHPGHGIGVKDYASADGYHNAHSERNQFINCTAKNTYESFYTAHESHHNEFIGCTAIADHAFQDRSWAGIIVRDGAHDNVFRDFHIQGFRIGVSLQETVEGPDNADQVVSNNVIANATIVDTVKGIELWNADNNLFTNCVFDQVGSWVFVQFPFERVGHGNSCRNSIVTNSTGVLFETEQGSTETFAFSYTDFWQNSFEMPEGVGNLAEDPLFYAPAQHDYHLKSEQGRWDTATSTWVKDPETSPCIDTGKPFDDYAAEPEPNGCRINMGIYGGTEEASLGEEIETCPSPPAASEGGCSCRMATKRASSMAAMLVAAGAITLLRRRRN